MNNDNHSQYERIEISLSPETGERMATAMEHFFSHRSSVKTKEQFTDQAIKWALECLESIADLTMMGLDGEA